MGKSFNTIEERHGAFDKKWIEEDRGYETPCHSWTGNRKSSKSYGTFFIGDKTELAHRYNFKRYTGIDIKGRNLINLCGNKTCVNPEHWKLTERLNFPVLKDVVVKEFCKRGHKKIKMNGHSRCYICQNTARIMRQLKGMK